MAARTEKHLASGARFSVDRRLERLGTNIFLDRSYVCHPSIAGMRSVLLPQMRLWVMFWEGQGGPHPCRCYMHMARVIDQGDTVVVEDLYLDVLVMQDGRWHVVDIDEFRAAIAAGELAPDQVQDALSGLENACHLVDVAGGDVESYLMGLLALEAN